jgi:hypothetical protein|tara:strand:+ start:5635 stop:5823 length:189 start_codon:yes stop_codon:yes gene_type:complete
MSTNSIPTAKLEAVNDMIAEAVDEAGDNVDLFLAKALFHLAVHHASDDALRNSLSVSLRDLG